jgi:demethylmenaquinone methyltransferase/2-methoxy-6-polyprenyl-1,4-benzoquinol methylase
MRTRNRARYARLAPLYDLLDRPFEPRYRWGRARIGAASAGLTLELGAGTGKNFPYYGRTARVIASDLAWPMLVRARRRLRPAIFALLVADAANLPIGDASVDTVTETFVYCVQADPRPALAEAARILRPGGHALFLEFVLPARGWLGGLMRLLEPPLRAVYGIRWRREPAHAVRFGRAEGARGALRLGIRRPDDRGSQDDRHGESCAPLASNSNTLDVPSGRATSSWHVDRRAGSCQPMPTTLTLAVGVRRHRRSRRRTVAGPRGLRSRASLDEVTRSLRPRYRYPARRHRPNVHPSQVAR